jgi:hypothetical protein
MNRPGVSEPNSLVAWSILGYLCSNPHAKDTAGGIGQWWLCRDDVRVDSSQVRATLDYLVMQGWLISIKGMSGSTVYALNRERLQMLQGLFPD